MDMDISPIPRTGEMHYGIERRLKTFFVETYKPEDILPAQRVG